MVYIMQTNYIISCNVVSVWFFYLCSILFNMMCVGQFCPVLQLCEKKGSAQYPVWGETNIREHPAEEWTKLPSEERWSMFVRNGAVSEDDGHLGTFVQGAWWTY